MSSDFFLRQMEGFAESLASALTDGKIGGREEKPYELTVSTDARGLLMDLRMLILLGQVNEAENLLFEQMAQTLDPALPEVARHFYAWLEATDDETLARCGFSREEIEEGRRDTARLYNEEDSHFA